MVNNFICPECGSLNIDIFDLWRSDLGIKFMCHDCGYQVYEKCYEDLDLVVAPKIHKVKSKRTYSRRKMNYKKAIRKKRISDSYSSV